MSAEVDAIAEFLVTAGLAGGSTGWQTHRLQSLDSPDQEITIYATGGPEPEQASDRSWRRPTFQIVARSPVNNPKAGSDKMIAILSALDRASGVTGLPILRATQSAPIALGPDPKGRRSFAVNFRAGES